MAREQLQTLTEPMYFVLLAIAQQAAHGYEIMRVVEEISAKRVKVGAGTMYALLTRFENEGIVRCIGSSGRRRTYALTDKGRGILRQEYLRLAECAKAFERVESKDAGGD